MYKSKRLIVSTQIRKRDLKQLRKIQKTLKVGRSAAIRAILRYGLERLERNAWQGSAYLHGEVQLKSYF